MRTTIPAAFAMALVLACVAMPLRAGTVDGTVKLGGVIMSDEGDLSAVQETYDIYDGFSLSQVRLRGLLDRGETFTLDLRDINRGSRQGEFVFGYPGRFRLKADFDQSRQVYDPARVVTTDRKKWNAAAQITATPWLKLSGGVHQVAREGDRLGFPAGVTSALGGSVDHRLTTGDVSAIVHQDRRGGALTYRRSAYSDLRDSDLDRTGEVVSVRLYAPHPTYRRWTHMVRGAYGRRELSKQDLDYTLANIQYAGTVEPNESWQVRYAVEGNRIDSKSTGLKTDRFRSDVDATLFHPYGRVGVGFGYETNDDDRSLTSSNSLRAGALLRYGKLISGKVDFSGRMRNDQEDLTLLKDVESSRIRAQLRIAPYERLSLGGGFSRRLRQFPDLNVDADGKVANAFARVEVAGWGALAADYSYAVDDYQDRAGRYETDSHAVTARVETERIPRVRLAAGVTYLDIGKDLDIEKSLVFTEGRVRVLPALHLEVKYNVYNYDDYVLIDRYYTANVVRIDLAYDLNMKDLAR